MYFCAKCGKKWPKEDAFDNELICTKKCGGELRQFETPKITTNIFISYGRDIYIKVAKRIKSDLSDKGYNVWFDDEHLYGGSDWENYIETGINMLASDPDHSKLIYIMTPHSTRKPDGYCLNELAYAIKRNVKIIPVMLLQSEPPLSIARIQYLDIKDCIDDLNNIREEIYYKHLDRLVDAIDHNRLDFEGTQSRLIDELNPLTFNNEMLYYIEDFIGREWLVNIYNKWVSEFNSPKVFWLVGPPGIGKSAISAWLREKSPSIKAFHFCNYKDLEKKNPVKLVTSISYQLATQLPEYMNRLAKLNVKSILSDYNDAYTLFEKLIAEPFMNDYPEPDESIVILIDALDEANENSDNDIARFIENRFDYTPKWLKLFVTSRNNDPCLTTILQSTSKTLINAEYAENYCDVKEYIRKQYEKISSMPKMTEDQLSIVATHCEGNFLYAKWLLSEIKENRYSINDIKNYPKGLGGIYSSYFARQFPDIQAYKNEIRTPLSIILAAIEPIEISLLKSIMDWKELESRDFIYTLGSLFNLHEQKISPYHKSIFDWLKNENNISYFTSIADGNGEIAAYGWETFCKSSYNLNDYFLKWLPKHLIRSAKYKEAQELLADENFVLQRIKLGFGEYITNDIRDLYDGGNTEDALCSANNVYSLLNNKDCDYLLLSIINITAQMYIDRGDYETALKWSERGLKAGHKTQDTNKMNSFRIVGDTCKARGFFNKALKYYSDSLAIASILNDTVSITKLYISAGQAYYGLFNFEESRKMYENAKNIINHNSKILSHDDLNILYDNLALVESCSGNINNSFLNRMSLVNIHNNNPSLNNYIKACRGLSHVLFHTLQFDYSLSFLLMAQKAHASVNFAFSDIHQKQLRWLSLLSRLNNQIQNAFLYSTELMDLTLASNDERNTALNLAERGCCLIYMNKINDGIELLIESLSYEVNTMPERSYRYLAEGFLMLGNLDEAEKNIINSLDIALKSCATETFLGYELYEKILYKQDRYDDLSAIRREMEASKSFIINQQISAKIIDKIEIKKPINSKF